MSEQDNLPFWRGERGRYEVWFLTMSAPDGRAGYWIRYTVRAPVTGPPESRAWFARFDRDDPIRTFGVNAPAELGSQGLAMSHDGFRIRLGESALSPGRAVGRIDGGGHEASWDLSFESGDPTYRLLPRPFYRGSLAPTKPYTPNPDLRFRGAIETDGETVKLEGAPGQQGHLFGSRHAERWAWAFCNAFEPRGSGGEAEVFQAISAQGRRGPFLTPLLTFAGLRIGGEWLRFRGTARRNPWDLGTWRLDLRARGYRLEGVVSAEHQEMVRVRYLDPDGSERWCHNSEVASSRLSLSTRGGSGWRPVRQLVSDGTTHAEWAGRTPATQVEALHVEVP
ncbi:MAG: tocopherol cyclase family protein [Actinomycetota bacterium]